MSTHEPDDDSSGVEDDQHPCPVTECEYTGHNRSALGAHFQSVHEGTLTEFEHEPGDHVCPWDGCDRDFHSDVALKSHYYGAHGERLGSTQVECANCGEPKWVKHSVLEHRERCFCDYDCQAEWRSENWTGDANPEYNRVEVECAHCSAPKLVKPSITDRERFFCDVRCMGDWLSENRAAENHPCYSQVETSCDWCDSDTRTIQSRFERLDHHFCNEDCWRQWVAVNASSGEDHHNWKDDVELQCEWCAETYYRIPSQAEGSRFCSTDCMAEWRSETIRGENHPLWKGGTFPYGRGWTEDKKESVRESQGRICAGCGKHESEQERRLSVHHIQKARSLLNAPADVRNGEDNLVALCDGCHQEWEQMSPLRPVTDDLL